MATVALLFFLGSFAAPALAQWADAREPFYLGMQASTAGSKASVSVGVGAAAGAAVIRVTPRGPADRAGLRPGDLVVQYGPYIIETVEDLVAVASKMPADAPQRLILVRRQQRLMTNFTTEKRFRRESISYAHPSGKYSLFLPVSWSVAQIPPGPNGRPPEYDRIDSSEQGYRLYCFRSSQPADNAQAAIDSFASNVLASATGARRVATQFGSAPGVWVAYYHTTDKLRTAVYRFAFVYQGRLYAINASAPAISDLQSLPVPLKHVMATLEPLSGQISSPLPPPTPPSSPLPPTTPIAGSSASPPEAPPPGMKAVELADVRICVPESWQSAPSTAVGEGTWYVGEWPQPTASIALLRTATLDELVKRLASPQSGLATIAGRHARTWEGSLTGADPPARVRVVVLAGQGAEPDLTWVCFGRDEGRHEHSAAFDRILKTVTVGRSAAEPVPASPDSSTGTPERRVQP